MPRLLSPPSFFSTLCLNLLSLSLLSNYSPMGNSLKLPNNPFKHLILSRKTTKPLPVTTLFNLPAPIPAWPPGDGFASGSIHLGEGLSVCQVWSFVKVWTTHEGGPDNIGASFFEPSPIPDGFFMLGSYAQPNNKPLYGWSVAAKDNSSQLLKMPIDYTLVWSSQSSKIKQDGVAYIWLPTPPQGYKAVGHLVTNTPQKPPLDKIRCVRADFTDQVENEAWIWGSDKAVTNASGGFNVFGLGPSNRGPQAQGVTVGTFAFTFPSAANSPLPLSCLKNNDFNSYASMPNLSQIEALVEAYSPLVYFHPDEVFLPSTVNWFFNNGGLLYTKGQESNPVSIQTNGSNLPQGGGDDGAYWLDLPVDSNAKDRVKKGDLQDAGPYLHVKPMLGGTFTDIAIWLYYPFNGAAKAQIEFITVSLGKIGEHVGDWEHVTLRISNFNGKLWGVYMSEHSAGTWVNASQLEFQNGNKPLCYSALHGHANYPKPGLVLLGSKVVGIRNDTEKSSTVMDTGVRYSIVAAEHLQVESPPWLNYDRKWGPKIDYDLDAEVQKISKLLPGKLKSSFVNFVKSLPKEILGEEGPTGPKMKNNWNGDEV